MGETPTDGRYCQQFSLTWRVALPSGKKKAQEQLLLDSSSALKEATGATNPVLQSRLIEQVRDALWLHPELSFDERSGRLQSAFAMLQGLKPADETEGMLATQMVAVHNAAMDCIRRAMFEGQTFEGRNLNLTHASKLLMIYARQMDALNKHRGKGQQKVIVEHVHVEAGGQAVVGHVETTNPSRSDDRSAEIPKAITHAPGKALEVKRRPRAHAQKRDK